SPRVTGVCEMTGGLVSSTAAAPPPRSIAAAAAGKIRMENILHIRAHLARAKNSAPHRTATAPHRTATAPHRTASAPPYLAAAGGGWRRLMVEKQPCASSSTAAR